MVRHERNIHRREWHCNICDLSYSSSLIYRDYIQRNHRDMFLLEQLQVVVDRGERSIDSEQSCPLCSENNLPRRLQSHLGRHLQQTALFVLPGSSEDVESDSVSGGGISSDEIGDVSPDEVGEIPPHEFGHEVGDILSDEIGEIPLDEVEGKQRRMPSTKSLRPLIL